MIDELVNRIMTLFRGFHSSELEVIKIEGGSTSVTVIDSLLLSFLHTSLSISSSTSLPASVVVSHAHPPVAQIYSKLGLVSPFSYQ